MLTAPARTTELKCAKLTLVVRLAYKNKATRTDGGCGSSIEAAASMRSLSRACHAMPYRVAYRAGLRGAVNLKSSSSHICATTWLRVGCHTSYGSYGCPLSYGVWWTYMLQEAAE